MTEERYQKTKKKISTIAIIVFAVGILVGGSLIGLGLMKQNKIDSRYSIDNKEKLSEQLETERQNLIVEKEKLEEKIEPVEEQIKKLDREPFTGFDDA